MYEDKDLVFLRRALSRLKESFKEIRELAFQSEIILEVQKFDYQDEIFAKKDIICFEDQAWKKKLSVDNYKSSSDIIKVSREYLEEGRISGLSNLVECYAEETRTRPRSIPFSEKDDVPNIIKNSFYYHFDIIEDIPSMRDYSPVNILLDVYIGKKQGTMNPNIDLDKMLIEYFIDMEFVFTATEPLFYRSRIWYERKWLLNRDFCLNLEKKFNFEFDDRLIGMLGTHCVINTDHILTIYKLRFIVIFIYTFNLKRKNLI